MYLWGLSYKDRNYLHNKELTKNILGNAKHPRWRFSQLLSNKINKAKENKWPKNYVNKTKPEGPDISEADATECLTDLITRIMSFK